MDLPFTTRIGIITHWYSALPRTLFLPGDGNIFTSDLTGDGSFAGNTTGANGDLLPTTNIGSLAAASASMICAHSSAITTRPSQGRR